MTNVANLPLRPAQMLAKTSASLDVLSGGRFGLGIGAGQAWDEIAGLGGLGLRRESR
jgi:alkanesulfonate monooxygenase SsuD/methylene tetrahydromethanopterin reductase-like flavin-dependent oxidoreductase (luciferase family)